MLASICGADSLITNNLETQVNDYVMSKTELDSHANMAVVGKHVMVIEDTGQTVEVKPFAEECQTLNDVHIVNALMKWENPINGKVHILMVKNALHVPSMDNNLIPPFLIREAGVKIKDVPKIHVDDPQVEDHSIYFVEEDVRIPMALNGIFSYFPTEVPTKKDLEECEDVLILTPVTPWNPNDTAYSKNEEAMLDHEGNMTRIEDRMKFILSEIQEDATLSSTRAISAVESKMIDNIFGEKEACYIGHYSPTNKKSMDPRELCCLMAEMHLDSHFKASVGATYPSNSKYLCEDEDDDTVVIDDNYNSEDYEDDIDLPELVDKTYDSDSSDDESDNDDDSVSPSITSHEDNDDESYDWCQDDLIEIERLFKDEKAQEAFMASAAHASKPKNFDAEHLSKVWQIALPMAKRTVDTTSQHCIRTKDATLSKNFSTNDRMLRYKRLNLYFFMDTFFATSKGGRSSRGHTCVQLFVTDKGYIYVIPMKKKSDVLQAVKQFAKEVGAPTAIICDAAREQTSSALKQFCNGMGTTLRVLEEGTPWANKAELYIGLMKEAVRKDMKDSNCPIPFWDYCLERRARINNLLAKDLFQLHGTNAHFSVTGEEGDISNLAQFGFYEWCYFRDHTQKFPFNQEVLGKVLGPASGEGNEMSQWILKINGRVVPRRTVRPLTVAEQHNLEEKKKRKFFEVLIEGKYGSVINPPKKFKI